MEQQLRFNRPLAKVLIKWSRKTRETSGQTPRRRKTQGNADQDRRQGDKGEIDGLGDQKTLVYLIAMSLKKLFMQEVQ